jgi:glycosyltransferase involved in cell wall biosynthesis
VSGPALHVGVNLLWLVPGVVGGSEEYTTRALLALAERDDPDLRVTLFALGQFAEAHPEVASAFPLETADLDGHRKPERVVVESTWLPRALARRGVDLVHHAGGVVPPGPSRIPSVLTVHDLQPLLMPENFSRLKRTWLGAMLPRSVKRARLVMTPSEPASESVVDTLGVARERVHTVPHGIEPRPPVDPDRVGEVRERYRLGGRSILYPAITYVHKDHRTLVAAFSRIAADHPDVTLVLTGGPGPAEAEVASAIRASGVGHRVRRTGRIPWDDLHAVYAAATVVAVPSRFEGFGAPALEAMAAGRPLVVADATALPWVVGDAAVKVAPGDVDAWASALARILDDPGEQDRLAAAGRERAAGFTWERTAAALAAGYRIGAGIDEDGGR